VSRPLRDIGELLRQEGPTAFPVPAPDDLRGRGFAGVACPKCGTPDRLVLRLEAVTSFECQFCGDLFTADAVRDHLDRWGAVLAWLALCPRRKE
jgi:Zn ribbon nucleic-acid-binding protein